MQARRTSAIAGAFLLLSCKRTAPPEEAAESSSAPSPTAPTSAGVVVLGSSEANRSAEASEIEKAKPPTPCPPEMVFVDGRFCVDRYEATLVDRATGTELSPYYPPNRERALRNERYWLKEISQSSEHETHTMQVPRLLDFQRDHDVDPMAVSRKGVLPHGYVTGREAQRACENAGKRLCGLEEWRLACGGEQRRGYPYGDAYVPGKCNVFREAHPAGILHNNPSIGHSDPRLNLVEASGKALLRKTGQTATCYSPWGGDGIADMVGNLDEWIADPDGTFVGGFYSRAKTDGCASTVRTHSFDYSDYSTGIRCCKEAPDR